MIQRLMNKKVVFGLIGGLFLLAAFGHGMMTSADEYRFVTWEKTANDNEVHVTLMLSATETVQKAGTFQVQFGLETEDIDGIDSAEFKFDSGIKKNSDITVKTSRYNEEEGTLTVYVSGARDDILKKGEALSLGTLSVNADDKVTVKVIEEGCKVADEEYQEREITVFGSQDSVTITKNDVPETPEESSPEEPSETTPPETPEESIPEESTTPETPEESIPEESTTPETPEESVSEESTSPETRRESDSEDSERNDPEETPGTWKMTNGAWNFTKEDGTPAQNEWIKVNGLWYWIGLDGKMVTGWINLNNTWYFCSPSGAMKTGWVNTGDRWYFMKPSGAMMTGWIQDKDYWYFMGESGAMKTGWTELNGKWFYLDKDGKMLADTITPDGFKVDKNGIRVD